MHLIGWVIFLLLPILFLGGRYGQSGVVEVIETKEFWFYFIIYCCVFYLNYLVLIPKLYFRKYKLIYILTLVILCFIVLFFSPFDRLISLNRPPFDHSYHPVFLHDNFGDPGDFRREGFPNVTHMQHELFPRRSPMFARELKAKPFIKLPDIFSLLLIIVIGIMLQGSRRLTDIEKKLLEIASEKSQMELAFLKAQINPHFLFNILNNIYSLAVIKHEETAEAVLKLSGIMRYVITDDVQNSVVPLSDEIECITDYIYLQRLRLGKTAKLDFSASGDFEGKYIAPLILITFIENIFKHGVSNHAYSPLTITLQVKEDNIHFTTRNKIFSKKETSHRGLGIANSEKRLKLMYENKYTLNISQENGWFEVHLTLKLN